MRTTARTLIGHSHNIQQEMAGVWNNQFDNENRDDLIRSFFYSGFTYAEIFFMLSTRHNVRIGVSHLKRILRKMVLKRKNFNFDIENVIQCISNELRGSGSSMGYRAMHQKLRSMYNLQVDQETVRICLKTLDPESVEERSKRRLWGQTISGTLMATINSTRLDFSFMAALMAFQEKYCGWKSRRAIMIRS